MSSIPLSTPGEAALEVPEFGENLTKIGLKTFRYYIDSVLPKELAEDEAFAAWFNVTDHSRLNLGFQRWQMNIFSRTSGMDLAHLGIHVPRSPLLPSVSYEWPELFDSPEHKKLLKHVFQHSALYLARTGYPKEKIPKQFRIASWAEVFGKGEAMAPRSHLSGAYLMGRYWVQAKKKSLKLNFEDPRGINPPYGKTYSKHVYTGELVLHPTWVSHFITPNMEDDVAVCYVFLVYPAGADALAGEDDLSTAMVIERPYDIVVAP